MALEHYSKLVMPYDLPQATIANGPETEMEYPTIIFSGPAFGMITHELGHEWFPMMGGSNETWDGSQEEGFNEFTDAAAAVDFEKKPTDWSREGASYCRIAGSELEPAMMWPIDFGGPYYSIQSNVKQPNGTLTLTVADRGKMPMPVIARVDFTDSSSQTIKRPASF